METQDIVISDGDDATFTYAGPFCINGATDPTATITGLAGGTFTGPADVVFTDTATGEIDLSASTAGTHTITYTTAGPCPCLLYTSPSPRDGLLSRMPSSA